MFVSQYCHSVLLNADYLISICASFSSVTQGKIFRLQHWVAKGNDWNDATYTPRNYSVHFIKFASA